MNFYRNNAEPILGGMTAETFHEFRTENLSNLEKVKDKIETNYFKHHSILLKVRPEQHNDEIRFKYVGAKILDYSFKKENWNLLDRLEIYDTKSEICNNPFY